MMAITYAGRQLQCFECGDTLDTKPESGAWWTPGDHLQDRYDRGRVWRVICPSGHLQDGHDRCWSMDRQINSDYQPSNPKQGRLKR